MWSSAKHNMGMAFDRRVWNSFTACADSFCHFDDYNWDWSLFHISLTCLERKLQVVLAKAPRVFHVGECGVHHKKKDCDASTVVRKVEELLSKAKNYLFPKEISVTKQPTRRKTKIPKGNGGWSDMRDRTLCIKIAEEEQRLPSARTATNALEATLQELGLI